MKTLQTPCNHGNCWTLVCKLIVSVAHGQQCILTSWAATASANTAVQPGVPLQDRGVFIRHHVQGLTCWF